MSIYLVNIIPIAVVIRSLYWSSNKDITIAVAIAAIVAVAIATTIAIAVQRGRYFLLFTEGILSQANIYKYRI